LGANLAGVSSSAGHSISQMFFSRALKSFLDIDIASPTFLRFAVVSAEPDDEETLVGVAGGRNGC